MLELLMALQWAEAIESLDYDSSSDKSFGMKQRPDGDIEIDEKFWEEEFHIPNCQRCNGILKPDVSNFPCHMIRLLLSDYLYFSALPKIIMTYWLSLFSIYYFCGFTQEIDTPVMNIIL